MIALNIERLLKEVDDLELPELGYPYVYSDRVMMKLFLYALLHHISGFKTLRCHLEERPDVLRLIGLSSPPLIEPLWASASKQYPRSFA